MRSRWIIVIALGALLALGVGLAIWMARNPRQQPTVPLPQGNVAAPISAEMTCIDSVLQDRNLAPDQVEARLAACQGTGAGNRQ